MKRGRVIRCEPLECRAGPSQHQDVLDRVNRREKGRKWTPPAEYEVRLREAPKVMVQTRSAQAPVQMSIVPSNEQPLRLTEGDENGRRWAATGHTRSFRVLLSLQGVPSRNRRRVDRRGSHVAPT